MTKLNELIDKYYQKSTVNLEAEIIKDLGFNPNFKQGELTIKDYAMKLGEFRTYYQQYKEADNKLNEIIKELKRVIK